MCGIFCWLPSHNVTTDNVKQWSYDAMKTLRHRGPDNNNISFIKNDSVIKLVLGHTRLSIIDLQQASNQPMLSKDGRYTIIFNGEIYNYLELKIELEQAGHQFTTNSDTEVLLIGYIAWGAEILKKITGMFAFAIYDKTVEQVFVSRDQFGIKPLYFYQGNEGIILGSEIPVLLKIPTIKKLLNYQQAFEYLRFGLTEHSPDTLFTGIKRLQPAHYMLIDCKSNSIKETKKYWEVDLTNKADLVYEEARLKLRDIFLKNIEYHMRSDVPVGAALSGGIDSSSIVCAITHLYPEQELHAFCYVDQQQDLSEYKWADIAAKHSSAQLHTISIEPEELENDFNNLIAAQGEPFGSTSIYAQHRVFKLAKQNNIKVMLDGQGADEIFGGYRTYQFARLASLIAQGKWCQALQFCRASSATWNTSQKTLLSGAISKLIPDQLSNLAHKIIGQPLVPKFIEPAILAKYNVEANNPLMNNNILCKDKLRHGLNKSLQNGLTDLLRYEDRNSMFSSIESRVPFLTTELVEFVSSLPEQYLIGNDGMSKRILRDAMTNIVPKEILQRTDKIGFATSELSWLSNLKPWVNKIISQSEDIPIINKNELMQDWNKVVNGSRPFDFRIWRCINFIAWLKTNNIKCL